jgi:hypothetical protein
MRFFSERTHVNYDLVLSLSIKHYLVSFPNGSHGTASLKEIKQEFGTR